MINRAIGSTLIHKLPLGHLPIQAFVKINLYFLTSSLFRLPPTPLYEYRIDFPSIGRSRLFDLFRLGRKRHFLKLSINMASQVDPNAKTGEAQGCPVHHGKGMPSGMPNPHHGIIFGGVQSGSGSHQYGPGDQIQDPNKPVKHDTQPGQEGLSTVSIPSTIPRANSDATWNYPSQQRFYNAMKKKGKIHAVTLYLNFMEFN